MAEDSEFYKNIIDNLYDGVYFVDRERVITYWNRGAERITGYIAHQVIGRSCRDNLLNHVSAKGIQLCQTQCPLAGCMTDGKTREADLFLHHADGHRLPVLVRASPLRDSEGRIIGAVETFSCDRGITTVRQELLDLRRTVQTDTLTGIGSRLFLEGRLHAAIAESQHRKDAGAGLLFLDIDHFKQFNDIYGHEVGDKVLRMVSSTLSHSMRRTDVVGRWGGEEFIAIAYAVASEKGLRITAEKLRMLVEYSRLDLAEVNLSVTVSIGATLILPTDTPESVINRADGLMYQSKQAGRNRITVG